MDEDQLVTKVESLEEEIKKLALNTSSMGLPQPEKYDGRRNFLDYLRSFNKVASAHGWLPARCAQILPLFMVGEARAAYDSLKREQKATWEELLEALAEKLTQKTNKEGARRELVARKQRKGESMREFSLALRDLVDRAYPDGIIDPTLKVRPNPNAPDPARADREKRVKQFKDEMARDFFRNGIRPEVREKVAFMPAPPTLEEAVNQAIEIEEIQQHLTQNTVAGLETTAETLQDLKAEICAVRVQQNVLQKEMEEMIGNGKEKRNKIQ